MNSAAIAESCDPGIKGFFVNVLREMMDVSLAQKGSLFLYDPVNEELALEAFFAPRGLSFPSARRKPGQGVSGKVFAGKRPVLVGDIARDNELKPNGFTHYRSASFISVPLVCPGDKPAGLINLTDKAGNGRFSGQDLGFVSTIAEYAGIIAGNMRTSESLKKEKERLEEQKELLARYATAGKLAAGVVHEINNPLDGVIRFTNMLINLQEYNSLPRDYLMEIRNGLTKIERVTRSLLQFSHHVNHKSMLIRNYADLSKIIEEALIACDAKSRGDVRVERDIRVGKKILDMGLSHVFISVIQNALDAMPGGGTLTVRAGEEDGSVSVSVSDSGPGIPTANKELIFDPFFTDKNNCQRSGLGLSKCREIISRYNGTIEAESGQGMGSVFRILIPDKFLEK